MDSNYLNALNKISSLKHELERNLEKAAVSTFEDQKACQSLEHLIEELHECEREIRHYSKPVEEGFIKENKNGRFSLNDYELTCGYSLEVWNEKYQEWNSGRVEHSDSKGGYYFYSSDMEHPKLYEGMKARIRN